MQSVLKDTTNKNNYYKTILIGTGAAGLYFGAGVPCGPRKDVLLLEKTARPAMKLLMAGSGQCNVTHGGSIKDFLECYGDHGSRIRTCLYKHNNLELMNFLEGLGVPLTEREDGKVFPASMDAHDVKNALMEACAANGVEIRQNSPVTQIRASESGFEVIAGSDAVYTCTNLVIATGGSERQVRSLASELSDKLAEEGIFSRSVEGRGPSGWILMDYGDIVINVFSQEQRGRYNIEKVWGDGIFLDIE